PCRLVGKLSAQPRIKFGKQVMDKTSKAFLKAYLSNASPTGHEVKGQEIWLNYIHDYIDEWHTDVYGTAYGIINPGKKYRVVIESHADEISWYVNYITDKGMIYVIRNGGSDQTIAASRRVNIHTPKGIVRGVFGWPAIHVRKGKDANLSPTMDNIFIDVGANNKQEVEELGKIGRAWCRERVESWVVGESVYEMI